MSTISTQPTPPRNPRNPTVDWPTSASDPQADPAAHRRMGDLTAALISFVAHVAVLLLMAVLAPLAAPRAVQLLLESEFISSDQDLLIAIAPPAPELGLSLSEDAPRLDEPLPALLPDAPNMTSPWAGELSSGRPASIEELMALADGQSLLQPVGVAGGGFEGRRQDARARMAGLRGGTAESENAVEAGLRWLALHQNENGGWRFDLQGDACQGQCSHPGLVGTTTGATALALLPFLGAGYTHQEGPYKETVQKGLYYLTNRMLNMAQGGDFQEGTMYAQGIAAIALCECYAMTRDESLRPFAQKAIDFICYAQHPRGGWRYYPGQPGDTTVTGWQLMALKSARMAGLEVPTPVIELVNAYLDGVQSADGALYGYQSSERTPGPTAVALLCRMYLGWQKDDRRLGRGVDFLIAQGMSNTDMYFNFYATQVLHHHDGSQWPRWNDRMRDFLVREQAKVGHETGSWFFHDRHGDFGGRLYNTAVCIMMLEVYYRHMPLYGADSVSQDF